MGDPYRIYFTPTSTDRAQDLPGSVAGSRFPGYLSSETPELLFDPTFPATGPRSFSSDFLQRDIASLNPGAYSVDGTGGIRSRPEPILGVTAGASIKDYPSLEVPSLISQRQEGSGVSICPSVPTDITNGRPLGSLSNADGFPALKAESNVFPPTVPEEK